MVEDEEWREEAGNASQGKKGRTQATYFDGAMVESSGSFVGEVKTTERAS